MAWPFPNIVQRGKPLSFELTADVVESIFNILNYLRIEYRDVERPSIQRTGKPSEAQPWVIALPQQAGSVTSWTLNLNAGIATCRYCAIQRASGIVVAGGELSTPYDTDAPVWLLARLNTETNELSLVSAESLPTFDAESEYVYAPLYFISDGRVIDYRTMPRLAVY